MGNTFFKLVRTLLHRSIPASVYVVQLRANVTNGFVEYLYVGVHYTLDDALPQARKTAGKHYTIEPGAFEMAMYKSVPLTEIAAKTTELQVVEERAQETNKIGTTV